MLAVLTPLTTHFMLILLRVAGIFAITPLFGRKNMVSMAKVTLCVLISYILLPIVSQNYIEQTGNTISYGLLCSKEILVGLCIGFITVIFLNAVIFAGQIIDVQMGFGMAQIFDPSTNTQIPITAQLLNTVLLLALLVTNGHLVIIQLFARSYEFIPVGQAVFSPQLAMFFLDLFSTMLVLGVKIAMPLIASAMIAEICFGIIVRSVPQMNIFVVGMPLKVILGMLTLGLMIPVYLAMTNTIFDSMFLAIENLFRGMSPI